MATRHYYSTKNFFRQMPNALLARYFEGQGLFSDLDFSAMNETKPDELFTAWLDLPKARRKPMDAEFRGVFELSCEKGCRAIIGETHWQLRADTDARTEFIEALSSPPNHYHRAMVAYLDHPECWKGPPASTTQTPCPTGVNASTWATTPRRLTTPASGNVSPPSRRGGRPAGRGRTGLGGPGATVTRVRLRPAGAVVTPIQW